MTVPQTKAILIVSMMKFFMSVPFRLCFIRVCSKYKRWLSFCQHRKAYFLKKKRKIFSFRLFADIMI